MKKMIFVTGLILLVFLLQGCATTKTVSRDATAKTTDTMIDDTVNAICNSM